MPTDPPARRPVLRRTVGILVAIVAVLVVAVVGMLVWAHTLFPADRTASLRAWTNPDVVIRETPDRGFVIEPADGSASQGLVFLPGARVEPAAYLYKLSALAEQGMTVVVPRVTLNLAIADPRSLADFTTVAPGVEHWAVGGHSLGGVRACMLAEQAETLVLFGSYCATEISETDTPVVVIGGSADGLSTPDKIDEAMPMLPDTVLRIEIEGANHADFGDYGPQPGDGVSTRTSAEVRAEIADAVVPLFVVPWLQMP